MPNPDSSGWPAGSQEPGTSPTVREGSSDYPSTNREPLKTQTPAQNPQSRFAGIPPAIARVLTAVVLLPILIASIVVTKLALLFVLIAAAAMVIALYEFWLLVRRQQVRADLATMILGAGALLTVFYFADRRTGLDFEMLQAVVVAVP